jgi:hypothetical protein
MIAPPRRARSLGRGERGLGAGREGAEQEPERVGRERHVRIEEDGERGARVPAQDVPGDRLARSAGDERRDAE